MLLLYPIVHVTQSGTMPWCAMFIPWSLFFYIVTAVSGPTQAKKISASPATACFSAKFFQRFTFRRPTLKPNGYPFRPLLRFVFLRDSVCWSISLSGTATRTASCLHPTHWFGELVPEKCKFLVNIGHAILSNVYCTTGAVSYRPWFSKIYVFSFFS